MKLYVCNKCRLHGGGNEACMLSCEDGLRPACCPHDGHQVKPFWEDLSSISKAVESMLPECESTLDHSAGGDEMGVLMV